MKTITKHYEKAGTMVLVQFETLAGEGFQFIPAVKALESGEMEIREARQEGEVNTLLAINGSGKYCLLTDMDLLKGARQNRAVNTSVLIAPHSKQRIGVSCVERSRWSYNSPKFTPAPGTMDPGMRAAKAASLRTDMEDMVSETQSKIWNLINLEMEASNVFSHTEDYNALLESKSKAPEKEYHFDLKEGCNGLAVFHGRELRFFDIFGNREVYRFYFEKLVRDLAFNMESGAEDPVMGKAEAFYRLDEFLDDFESKLGSPVEREHGGVGEFRWSGLQDHPGFALSFKAQPVHMVGFSAG